MTMPNFRGRIAKLRDCFRNCVRDRVRGFLQSCIKSRQKKMEHERLGRVFMALVIRGESKLRTAANDGIIDWSAIDEINQLEICICDAHEDIISGIASDLVFSTILSLMVVHRWDEDLCAELRELSNELADRLFFGSMTDQPSTIKLGTAYQIFSHEKHAP